MEGSPAVLAVNSCADRARISRGVDAVRARSREGGVGSATAGLAEATSWKCLGERAFLSWEKYRAASVILGL